MPRLFLLLVAALALLSSSVAQESVEYRLVVKTYDAKALLERKTKEGKNFWIDGQEITFISELKADGVFMCCSFLGESNMTKVQDGLFASTFWVREVNKVVLSLLFLPTIKGEPQFGTIDFNDLLQYRGADAPKPRVPAILLQGKVDTIKFLSKALNETRDVFVYTPPNFDKTQKLPVIYLADGESVQGLAPLIEPAILSGEIPQVVLVGMPAGVSAQTGAYDVNKDFRAQEYLLGINLERFKKHETFFTEEVRLWAEQTYGVATDLKQRAVYGFSNGGTFAASMGERHPELYGKVMAFSVAGSGVFFSSDSFKNKPIPEFYLVAGTLETPFYKNVIAMEKNFKAVGIPFVSSYWVTGHEFIMWSEELIPAIKWAFKR